MPFSGNTFTKLYSWLIDPQRNDKIFNSRLDDEFGGIATGLSTVAGRLSPVAIADGGTGQTSAAAAFGALKQAATDTATGVVEKATQAEAEAGTADKYPDAALIKHNPGVAKAWVSFNGTGTVAIRASHNVTSITDNGGTGDYTVTFTTAFSSANYVAVLSAGRGTAGAGVRQVQGPWTDDPTGSAFRFLVLDNAGGGQDAEWVFAAFYGDQ